jgi:hypothetical protein
MQEIIKDIFKLNRCGIRGDENNRCLFAAMELNIQMHQLEAFKLDINLEYQRAGFGVNFPIPHLSSI